MFLIGYDCIFPDSFPDRGQDLRDFGDGFDDGLIVVLSRLLEVLPGDRVSVLEALSLIV